MYVCARARVSFCSEMNVHALKMGNNSAVIPLNWICWMSFYSFFSSSFSFRYLGSFFPFGLSECVQYVETAGRQLFLFVCVCYKYKVHIEFTNWCTGKCTRLFTLFQSVYWQIVMSRHHYPWKRFYITVRCSCSCKLGSFFVGARLSSLIMGFRTNTHICMKKNEKVRDGME